MAYGDTIVFEKLEGHNLRGTIFRALPLVENAGYLARDPQEVEKTACDPPSLVYLVRLISNTEVFLGLGFQFFFGFFVQNVLLF